jgi:hypothetical protein
MQPMAYFPQQALPFQQIGNNPQLQMHFERHGLTPNELAQASKQHLKDT